MRFGNWELQIGEREIICGSCKFPIEMLPRLINMFSDSYNAIPSNIHYAGSGYSCTLSRHKNNVFVAAWSYTDRPDSRYINSDISTVPDTDIQFAIKKMYFELPFGYKDREFMIGLFKQHHEAMLKLCEEGLQHTDDTKNISGNR